MDTRAPFAGVGVVPGSGATPTPASPAPDTVPGSGAASGPEGAAEPSAPLAGVGVVPGSGATPTPAPPAPDAVPGSGAASGPEGALLQTPQAAVIHGIPFFFVKDNLYEVRVQDGVWISSRKRTCLFQLVDAEAVILDRLRFL